jgi:uncharacterized protein
MRLGRGKSAVHVQTVVVRNQTRDILLAESADVADTSATRQKGLLGRDRLSPGQGLWIVPCEGVHTCGMRFPIDVLYLDRHKRVRKLRHAMMPWRLSLCFLAHSVLELPAGMIEESGTKTGDQLDLVFRPI